MLLSTVMPVEDSVRMEKIIPELTVTAKQSGYLADMPIAATTLGAEQLEVGRVESVKDMSAVVPNFYQPDYGSAMTSSIYASYCWVRTLTKPGFTPATPHFSK